MTEAATATDTPRVAQAERLLMGAAAFFAGAVLLHNLDHVRRGADGVTADVFVAGTAAILLEVAAVVLCVQRHRRAPALAAFTGLSLAAGYLLVHFTPPRGWLSDSLISGAGSPLSLAAASLEVVAAVALAVAGVSLLRRPAAEQSSARPLRTALAHPVSLTMVLGNVVVLVASAAQRA